MGEDQKWKDENYLVKGIDMTSVLRSLMETQVVSVVEFPEFYLCFYIIVVIREGVEPFWCG